MTLNKVLIIEPSGNLWGSERVLLDFISTMAASDYDVTVCYPPLSPIEDELINLKVKLLPVFVSELHRKSIAERILFILKITSIILRRKPDLIYVNQAGATRSVMPSAMLLRDRKSTRLNSSHTDISRMPSSA